MGPGRDPAGERFGQRNGLEAQGLEGLPEDRVGEEDLRVLEAGVASGGLGEVFWVAVGIATARSGLAVPPEQLASGNEGEPGLDPA